MRLVSYYLGNEYRVAGVRGTDLVDIAATDPSLPCTMRGLLAGGATTMEKARAAIACGQGFDPASVQLVAPVPDPEKVICIGLNYADHAAESGQPVPGEPVVFCKFPTAVRAHGDAIVLPKSTQKVDYEAELVAIIGVGGKHIPREKALEHVAGYCCGNDVSARDWQLQKPGGQWLLGKTFDSFAPFGPYLVTADEVGDPGSLDIKLRLDGETMQNSNTRQFIFSLDKVIAYLSTVCTLKPGDVIFTGTPPGVGGARKPPVFMKAGQRVEVEIEKIGTLVNHLVDEE